MVEQDYTKILENRIFNYYLGELENFLKEKSNNSLRESLSSYSESDVLNSYLHMNYFVEKVLTPEFGLSLRDILSALKENKTTYRNYILNIMTKPEFNLQEALLKDGFNFKEDLLSALVGDNGNSTNGAMTANNEEVDPEEVKKRIIQTSLGNENINLDSLSDEELDALLARTASTMNEKISIIKNYLKEKDDETIAKCISHYTGMHFNEALEIIKEGW